MSLCNIVKYYQQGQTNLTKYVIETMTKLQNMNIQLVDKRFRLSSPAVLKGLLADTLLKQLEFSS